MSISSLEGFGAETETGSDTGQQVAIVQFNEYMNMAIDPGPLQGDIAKESLLGRVRQLLAAMGRRNRFILECRMGMVGPPASLEDIARSFSLTRERIRQLEIEAVQGLSPMFDWFQELTRDLADVLRRRESPLTFLGAVEMESRLQGMTRSGALMSYLLQRLKSEDIYMVCIRGITYLMLLSQRDWEEYCAKILREFRTDEWAGTPVSECRQHVLQRGQGLDKGALELCWQEIVLSCGFVSVPQGTVLKPSTYSGWVRYVLSHTDQPMYLADIKSRIQELSGRELPEKSVHNAITNTAVLFSRGLYGLEQHIRISSDSIPDIITTAEQQVRSGPPYRQWHASELLSAVTQELGPVPGLTKYTLNHILRNSRSLQNLNRMVWGLGEPNDSNRMARINIRDAVLAILEEAGYPLSIHEIHKQLMKQRGLDQDLNFQIHAGEQLVHLASGLWGIKGRDDLPELFASAAEN